jgi:hypothetical protein
METHLMHDPLLLIRIALLARFVNHAVPADIYPQVEKETGADHRLVLRLFAAMRLAGVVERSSPHKTREASFILSRPGHRYYESLLVERGT